MSKNVDTTGFVDLTKELASLADELYAHDGHYGRTTRYVLQMGATPVYMKMRENASRDPKPITRTLLNSIKIGNVIKRRRGGWSIQIGVRRGEKGADYANPLEYGHGGPHPAPAHPFVRPAFDEAKEEAYAKMKEILIQAIDARKKK